MAKTNVLFYINSWEDLPSFGRGLGRQDAAMFAQIATLFLRVASLEAAWGWQLLLEPDLEAIWKRFGRVLNEFWLQVEPSWAQNDPQPLAFGFQVESSWAQNGSQPLASTQIWYVTAAGRNNLFAT